MALDQTLVANLRAGFLALTRDCKGVTSLEYATIAAITVVTTALAVGPIGIALVFKWGAIASAIG